MIQQLDELTALPFALPDIGDAEIAEVVDTLQSGWLTTGPKTRKFEQDFADRIGVKHALAVNSATAGLHLSLEACGIKRGDKVLTTTMTFTATAEVIRYFGADPVFVDIDPATFNMDVAAVRAILENTTGIKAIMPVHFAGEACDMDPLLKLADQHGLKVIEDAAHALPTTYKGRMIGTLGDATVYSFYVTKTLATGEGGMVVTNDDEMAARIKIMRLHGISKDVFDRYQLSDKPTWHYDVVNPGFKYNMTDIAASIGLHQLQKIDRFASRREQIANAYGEAFKDLPVRCPKNSRPDDQHAWHLYVLRLDLEKLSIDRNRFIELMNERKIGTSVHFIPLHLQSYWSNKYDLKPQDFPVASKTFECIVSLPIYTKMRDDDVARVIDAVKTILKDATI